MRLLVSDDKIIQFPLDKIANVDKVGPVDRLTERAAKKNVERQTKEFIEGNIDELAIGMLQKFVDMGIRSNKETFTKDLAMIIESVRGLLYRDFNLKHPMQSLVDKTVSLKQTKTGSKSAQIDYSKIMVENKMSKNTFSKDIKNELDDLQNGGDMFTPDGDLDE